MANIPMPPEPKGDVQQQIRQIFRYLFQLAQILNRQGEDRNVR